MAFVKGHKPWNKGKSRSLKTKEKISKARKGQHNSPKTEFKKGYTPWDKNKNIWKNRLHPMSEKKHTKKSRLKMGLHHKNYSGKNNPMYGKNHSKETKQKISNSKKGKSNIELSRTRKKLFAEGKLVPWNKNKSHLQKEKHPLWNKTRPEYVKRKISEGLIKWHKKHEHPRGTLGKRHSEKTKQKIKLKLKRLWKNPK